jgi:hypothetical protein
MDEGESGAAQGQLRRTVEKINFNNEDINTGSLNEGEGEFEVEDEGEVEGECGGEGNNNYNSKSGSVENLLIGEQVESQEVFKYIDTENERLETEGNANPSDEELGKNIIII